MSRTRWLAAIGVVSVASGAALRLPWPSAKPALDCPLEAVRWTDAGTMLVASCSTGVLPERAPAGPMMTLGGRLRLNEASADDLALIPGIGPTLAKALVKARGERPGFQSWEEVDEVSGVGPAKLRILKEWTELR